MNQYDDKDFFEAYKKMPRSSQGLKAAGEWGQLRKMFPKVEGKAVLDLGCGYGWHCKFVNDQGAREVLGIDISEKMIEVAKEKNSGANITYEICGIEEYSYPKDSWDLLISNLALHYIEDLDLIFKKVHHTLKEEGIFLFNIEHPTFTAGINQDWIYSEDGKALYWPVDDYFFPGKRDTNFLGQKVEKYHHTLTQIVMGLIENAFEILALEEARPPEEMMDQPGFENELRRPMMLLIKARKK